MIVLYCKIKTTIGFMAFISTIRKHSGILVGIISIGIILFLIGGDIIHLGTILIGKHRQEVGELSGQKIALTTYQSQIEQRRRSLPTHVDVQEQFIREYAWQELIAQLVYEKACNTLGLMVSEAELIDMVQGEHIHPELQMAFQDPKTKQFSKKRLTAYLQSLAAMPEERQQQWYQFERFVAAYRQREKLQQIMAQSVFITTLEVQAQHEAAQPTLHAKFLYVPYHTQADDTVRVTEKMLNKYLLANKRAYQTVERRGIQYIIFPMVPTQADEKVFHEELSSLKVSFAQATDGRAFAKSHTDGQPDQTYCRLTVQQLPDVLQARSLHLKKDMVIGPVQEGSIYKLYKVIACNVQEDNMYDIALIEKKLVPGDSVRNQVFRQADYCANTVKCVAQLKAYADQEALTLHEAQVGKNDVQVGPLAQARELVRWLYNEATVGKISPAFELEHRYVVAIMTQHVRSGASPLAQVRDVILEKVRNEQKANSIIHALRKLTGDTLTEKATQYGRDAKWLEVKHLHFQEDTLPQAGMARKVIGTAFSLQPGKQAIIADDNGVFLVEVVAKNEHAAVTLEDIVTQQQGLRKIAVMQQPNHTFQALKSLAKIKDNRYKFY